MTASVEILRDHTGVPHVYAERTTDVYFGLGYAMAEDRLWQMDWLRRRPLSLRAGWPIGPWRSIAPLIFGK